VRDNYCYRPAPSLVHSVCWSMQAAGGLVDPRALCDGTSRQTPKAPLTVSDEDRVQLRIPGQSDHRFRSNPITDSGVFDHPG